MEENKIEQNKPQEGQAQPQQPAPIKPDILDYDDIRKMVPFFDGKPKLVKWLFHLLDMDDANWIHGHNCHTPGVWQLWPWIQLASSMSSRWNSHFTSLGLPLKKGAILQMSS